MAYLVFSFGKLKSIIGLYALCTYIKTKHTEAAQFMTPQAEEAIAQSNPSRMSPELHASLTLVFT